MKALKDSNYMLSWKKECVISKALRYVPDSNKTQPLPTRKSLIYAPCVTSIGPKQGSNKVDVDFP